MVFENFVKEVITLVEKQFQTTNKLVTTLTPLKKEVSPNKTQSIILSTKKAVLNYSIGGVDSGFVSKKLSFMDLVLIKTAGVVFSYKDSKLVSSTYHPTAFTLPTPILLKSGLELEEELKSVSLIRLEKELTHSIKIINEFAPKYFFVDGSLVPQIQDKPKKDSILDKEYFKVIELIHTLFSTAKKNSTTLIGCVEDSKGNRFRQILQEEIIPTTTQGPNPNLFDSINDIPLLDSYLLEGEKTFSFPYTTNPSNHQILKDYSPEWAKKIFVFYLKCTQLDNPLRVEFILNEGDDLSETSEIVSSVVHSLSSLHKEYSFPSILIEADIRARLSEQEINLVYNRLIDKLGTKYKLRRNNRPF